MTSRILLESQYPMTHLLTQTVSLHDLLVVQTCLSIKNDTLYDTNCVIGCVIGFFPLILFFCSFILVSWLLVYRSLRFFSISSPAYSRPAHRIPADSFGSWPGFRVSVQHPSGNAFCPISVTLSGTETSFRSVSLNASSPMVFRLFGRVNVFRG